MWTLPRAPLGVGLLRLAGWQAYTRDPGWVAQCWEKTSRLPNIWLTVLEPSYPVESSGGF